MSEIIADNFPEEEYEFNTTPQFYYREPEGTKILHNRDLYKDELFYKLLLCPICKIIIALYEEPYGNTPMTYNRNHEYIPRHTPCYNVYNIINPPLKR